MTKNYFYVFLLAHNIIIIPYILFYSDMSLSDSMLGFLHCPDNRVSILDEKCLCLQSTAIYILPVFFRIPKTPPPGKRQRLFNVYHLKEFELL